MTTLSAARKPFATKDLVLYADGSKALAGELDVWHHAVNFPAGIRVDGA